jgi:hypothetical protein
VHVLLDRKGKTLSHAFVEVANEEVAKSALRSAQNSVLGKGKRARGVTVTRSGQEELMRAVSHHGSFMRRADVIMLDSCSRHGGAILMAQGRLLLASIMTMLSRRLRLG